jgi:hypothetical protein
MSVVKRKAVPVEETAVALLMIAAVTAILFGCFISFGAASTVPATQTITSYGEEFIVNYDNLTIWLDGSSSSAIVGQEIQFFNATGGPSGTATLRGISDNNAGVIKFDLSGRIDLSGIETGDYNVTGEAPGCNVTVISIGETAMELKLKKDTKTITSTPKGTRITVSFTSSLDPHDGASLEVKDPSGNVLKVNPADGTVFDTVNIEHITNLEIDTTGWELGTYTLKVSTKEEYARGLEKESNEVKLEIVSSELKIKAQKTEVVENENVKLTVTGAPDLAISIAVDRNAEHAIFPKSINDNPANEKIGSFTDKIDADGKREYVVYFDRIGSYTVRVNASGAGAEDYVDIAVLKKKVTFTTPETCAIGSDLVINGTANTGKTVDIAINDLIVKAGVAIDSAGKFEVKLPTPDPNTPGTGTEDAITIKGFINGNYTLYQNVAGEDYDGSAMVLMVAAGLTAESSVSVVAPGDSFTLSGTAPGSKVVDILVVGPKGGSGHGMNPTNSEENGLPSGMSYETASASSGISTWSIDLKVDEDADTGTYLVFVFTPGKNQVYDGLKTADLLAGLSDTYFAGDLSKFGAKTQEQIRAMLAEVTTGAAGSDDQLKVLKLTVRRPEVAVYVPAEVIIGENLTISGSSNREGHTIIIKVKGPLDLGTKFVTVVEGQFEATFSTIEALTGEYTVEATDGEGHTDTAPVTIIPPIRVWEEPSATPGPSGTPSVSTPSEEPELTPEPTPTEPPASPLFPVPGFEMIAGLVALLTVFLSAATARRGKR